MLTIHEESDKNLINQDSLALVPLNHPATAGGDSKMNPFKRP